MALYLPAHFAKLCGKSRGYIATYISRKKLRKSGDYIDSNVRENNELMIKWIAEKKHKEYNDLQEAKANGKVETKNEPEPKSKDLPAPNVSPPVDKVLAAPDLLEGVKYDKDAGLSTLDRQKAEIELELKRARIINLELDSAKKRGENIPTDIVSSIISALGHNFQRSYKAGAESLMMEFNHKNKIPPEQVAKLKSDLIKQINKSQKNAIDEAVKELQALIEKQSN